MKNILNTVWQRLRRVLFEIVLLTLIGGVLFLLPVEIKKQGLELFLFKVLLFSASQIHAHLTRKLIFPYINFRSSAQKTHQWMVVALHLGAAYLYGVGG
jgi:hypothetical protein